MRKEKKHLFLILHYRLELFSLLTATLDLLSRALLAVHPRAFLSRLCECVSVSAGAACACTHLPIPEAEHNPPPSPCASARHGRPPSFNAGPGASLTNAQHNPRINWSKCHYIGSYMWAAARHQAVRWVWCCLNLWFHDCHEFDTTNKVLLGITLHN